MIRELVALILHSQSGRFAQSTWKSILGVAMGVTLMLFITGKLDSFIINMEDYMLNFLPEIQFQRTKNSFPVALKFNDKQKIKQLIGDDPSVLVQGAAFIDMGIYQLEAEATHINKRCLLFSGLVAEVPANKTNSVAAQTLSEQFLLNITPYLQLNEPITTILAKGSNKIIISKRLKNKLFTNTDAIGQTIKIGRRKSKPEDLITAEVAGIYNIDSVNAIFLPQRMAAKIAGKPPALWANTYIVRLKDKYQSKPWRQQLYDKQIALRTQAQAEIFSLTQHSQQLKKQADNFKSQGDLQQSITHQELYNKYRLEEQQNPEYQRWDAQRISAKNNLDFLSPFQVQSWMDISPENLKHLKMTRKVMLVIFATVLILTGLSIKFLFDTVVIEKRRQISTLKAIGFSNHSILLAFILSGGIIGGVGVLIGAVMGFTLNGLTALIEQQYFSQLFSFQYRNVWPTVEFTFSVMGLTLLLCMLSAILPAFSVLKIQPIDGLKREG